MKRIIFALLACVSLVVSAQVTTSPSPIPLDYQGQVVITFDPTKGTGGMVGATKCYAHTGVLTSASTSASDWKYVVSSWRADNTPQLTATADGKWQLTIDNIYTFYACPQTETITALVFVFHDGKGGSKEGKASGGKDIVVTLGEEPEGDIWDNFTPAPVVEQARPLGVSNGIYYGADGTSVTLCTYAASKTQPANHVFLLGDMTNWKLSNDYQLYRDGNYFWITLTGLEKGKEYRFQYAVERADGIKKQISDLYSEKVLHPDDAWEPRQHDPSLIGYPIKGADGGYVTVIQPGKPAYNWSNATTGFVRPDKNNLVIYELWTYDFSPARSFNGILDRLDYISTLGVNAIEFMPLSEFDGNYNWGYSPNHYLALDKSYGTPEEFKALVDACHSRGIAVIVDMVFNHATGLNPMNKLYPYTSSSATTSELRLNPFFNVTPPHSDTYYEDWNHGFEPAHEMFVRALQYWLDEYKVDGFRMDLSHGFCSDKANTSVENIKDYYNRAIAPNVDANGTSAYFILEHWGSNMNSERPQLVNAGCLCWNNTSNAYCQTAMGWLKEGDAFTDASKDGYVSYTCSHDEERPFYKAAQWGNGAISSDEATRLGRVAENVIMNIMLNGSHMIWQYEELGYDFSINSSSTAPTSTNSDNRCNIKPRPEAYGYFSSPERQAAYMRIAQAAQLRTRLLPAVFAGNPTASQLGSGQKVRYVQWGSDVYVVANFDAAASQTVTLPTGTWYDFYAGGVQTAPATVTLAAGEVRIYTGSAVALPVIDSQYFQFMPVEQVWDASSTVYKTIEDNQLVIILDGKKYDMYGRLIR